MHLFDPARRARRPHDGRALRRVAGGAMIGLGVRLVMGERP